MMPSIHIDTKPLPAGRHHSWYKFEIMPSSDSAAKKATTPATTKHIEVLQITSSVLAEFLKRTPLPIDGAYNCHDFMLCIAGKNPALEKLTWYAFEQAFPFLYTMDVSLESLQCGDCVVMTGPHPDKGEGSCYLAGHEWMDPNMWDPDWVDPENANPLLTDYPVKIGNDKHWVEHSAVYLGSKWFLSKYGKFPLLISKWEDIQKAYGVTKLHRMNCSN